MCSKSTRLSFRIASLTLALLLCFLWVIEPPLHAHALAADLGLWWLIQGLFTAQGVSFQTLQALENMSPPTDFRGNAGNKFQVHYNSFLDWGLTYLGLNAALTRLASQLTDGSREIPDTPENREDLALALDAAEEYVTTNIWQIADISDWQETTPIDYGIDQTFYSWDNVNLTVGQNNVQGSWVPTSSTSSARIYGNSNVYSFDVSSFLGNGGSTTNAYITRWIDEQRRIQNDDIRISLYQRFGVDFYLKCNYEYINYSSYYTFEAFSDGVSLGKKNIIWTSSPSGITASISAQSNGTYRLLLERWGGASSPSSQTFTIAADSSFGQFCTWATQAYQGQIQGEHVEGSGMVYLTENVQAQAIADTIGQPFPDNPEYTPPPLMYFPEYPTRYNDELGTREIITDVNDVTWNDLTAFNQAEGMTGYPDQVVPVDPPAPTPPGYEGQPLPEIDTGITLSGFEVPWHYVTDTITYIGSFFSVLGSVFEFMPTPILYLGLAVVVLSITFGLLHKFLQ